VVELARRFLGKARAEIEKGGDYRERLEQTEDYRTLVALIDNASDIISKAEAESDTHAFLMKELAWRYNNFREFESGQHNFVWPFYYANDCIVEAEGSVIREVRERYPQMVKKVSDEVLRILFRAAAYKADGEFLADWESRYGKVKIVAGPLGRLSL